MPVMEQFGWLLGTQEVQLRAAKEHLRCAHPLELPFARGMRAALRRVARDARRSVDLSLSSEE
jgi:hypothetical protein